MLLKTFKMHKKGVHDVFVFGVVGKYVVCMIKQDKENMDLNQLILFC